MFVSEDSTYLYCTLVYSAWTPGFFPFSDLYPIIPVAAIRVSFVHSYLAACLSVLYTCRQSKLDSSIEHELCSRAALFLVLS